MHKNDTIIHWLSVEKPGAPLAHPTLSIFAFFVSSYQILEPKSGIKTTNEHYKWHYEAFLVELPKASKKEA